MNAWNILKWNTILYPPLFSIWIENYVDFKFVQSYLILSHMFVLTYFETPSPGPTTQPSQSGDQRRNVDNCRLEAINNSQFGLDTAEWGAWCKITGNYSAALISGEIYGEICEMTSSWNVGNQWPVVIYFFRFCKKKSSFQHQTSSWTSSGSGLSYLFLFNVFNEKTFGLVCDLSSCPPSTSSLTCPMFLQCWPGGTYTKTRKL